jgi:Spy/CpxP family protein refolding chaperone
MGARLRGIYIPLILVFLSGALVGGFAHRLYTMNTVKADTRSGQEESRRRYLDEMHTRLKLSDQQMAQLSDILDATREKFKAIREQGKPAIKLVKDEHAARVNAMLAEDQRAEYAKLREEREQKRAERERLEQEREAQEKAARTRR